MSKVKKIKLKMGFCSKCGHACILSLVSNGKWEKRDKGDGCLVLHKCQSVAKGQDGQPEV